MNELREAELWREDMLANSDYTGRWLNKLSNMGSEELLGEYRSFVSFLKILGFEETYRSLASAPCLQTMH